MRPHTLCAIRPLWHCPKYLYSMNDRKVKKQRWMIIDYRMLMNSSKEYGWSNKQYCDVDIKMTKKMLA